MPGELTVRIAYNLFHAKAEGGERRISCAGRRPTNYQQGDDYFRLNGGGEMLVYSAADFEDFREPRPDMPARDGNRSRRRGADSGAEPLAVAAACDL